MNQPRAATGALDAPGDSRATGGVLHWAEPLRAIRDALVWLLPLLMAWSLLQFLAALLAFLELWPVFARLLSAVNAAVATLFPYALTIALSTLLALRHHLPRPPVALLGFGYLAVVMAAVGVATPVGRTLAIFVGLTLPFLTVPLLARLSAQSWTRLTQADLAGRHVQTNLNLVLPAIVVAVVVALAGLALSQLAAALAPVHVSLDALASQPTLGALAYALLNSLLWAVGVHGYYALLPLLQALDAASQSDLRPSNLLGAFVFIGGSGATLSLSLALLLFARGRTARWMGIASLPVGLFNVNELLVFGLPIIFNRRLLLPFFLAPAVNVLIASAAVTAGWVRLSSLDIPFTSPILVNAWIATGGSLSGPALQLVCLLAGVALYVPFMRWNEARTAPHHIHLRSFDTTFAQREDELTVLLSDPVGEYNRRMGDQQRLAAQLGALSDKEFFLQYQPVTGVQPRAVVGCEALMRMRQDNGTITYPGAFMTWFAQAGLEHRIDLWALEQAIAQQAAWLKAGLELPINVNISPASLGQDARVDNLLHLLRQGKGRIHLEITEQALAGDVAQVERSLQRLRDAGPRIYIDDFGTGYSSLSYLYRFPVDAIKIDRSFVLSLDQPRGRLVFDGLIGLAQRLDIGIVVEGVETQAQLACVPLSAKASVQGWLYSRALDGDAMPGYVQRFTPHG